MKPDKKQLKQSKQIETPRTEVTLAQAQTTKHFYLIIGLILFVIIAGGGFGIYKLLSVYSHRDSEIKAQNKLKDSLDKKIEALDALKEPYAKINDSKGGIGSEAAMILRALPITEDYKALVAMMDNIASVSGVKMLSISKTGDASAAATPAPSPAPAADASGTSSTGTAPAATGPVTQQPKTLVFTIGLEGKYDMIIKFLENTEKASRVVNFKSMKISPGGENIKADLTMETYYQDEANIDSTFEELK